MKSVSLKSKNGRKLGNSWDFFTPFALWFINRKKHRYGNDFLKENGLKLNLTRNVL